MIEISKPKSFVEFKTETTGIKVWGERTFTPMQNNPPFVLAQMFDDYNLYINDTEKWSIKCSGTKVNIEHINIGNYIQTFRTFEPISVEVYNGDQPFMGSDLNRWVNESMGVRDLRDYATMTRNLRLETLRGNSVTLINARLSDIRINMHFGERTDIDPMLEFTIYFDMLEQL